MFTLVNQFHKIRKENMSRQVVVMQRLKIKKVGKAKSMQITQTKK